MLAHLFSASKLAFLLIYLYQWRRVTADELALVAMKGKFAPDSLSTRFFWASGPLVGYGLLVRQIFLLVELIETIYSRAFSYLGVVLKCMCSRG